MQSSLSALVAASLLVAGAGINVVGHRWTKPHIVLVLADDLGYNDVGWNGGELQTPYLTELIGQGVLFNEFHAHSVCTPSRASILSGRYAFHTGLQHGFIPIGGAFSLSRNVSLIGQHLKEQNYITHMVGKWHLGHVNYADLPLNRGFDSFYGMVGSAFDYYTHTELDYLDLWDGCSLDRSNDGVYSTTLFTDKAIAIINGHDPKQPMFLYLAYNAVHARMEAPPDSDGQYAEIPDAKRQLLAKMVAHLDTNIQRVVSALQDKDMWNNTLLVFTSDNGGATWEGSSNWPYRGAKFSMWQGGHKVPTFMVHGGGLIAGGQTFDFLGHVMDLAPTFMAAAGAKDGAIASKGYDGVNLWPVLTGKVNASTLDSRYLVLNIDTVEGSEMYSGYAGIRNKEWKLTLGLPGEPSARCRPWPNSTETEDGDCSSQGKGVPSDTRQPHLWNLQDDVSESNDVAGAHPDVVEQLTEALQPYLDSAWAPIDQPDASDDALLAASVHGGWIPWEACPDDVECVCNDLDAIAVFEAAKNHQSALLRRGAAVPQLTRPPRTRLD